MQSTATAAPGNDGGRDSDKLVDREKTCPLLLRVFCNTGRHHSVNDYARGRTPTNELQIYTWMDATLRELAALVKEVNPDARRRGTYFDFSIVYPDPRTSVYRLRDIGSVCAGARGADDHATLQSKKFVIGDYIDIAITPPTGQQAPVSSTARTQARSARRARPY